MTEYKLTDKWPGGWIGKELGFDGTLYFLSDGLGVHIAKFHAHFVRQNPDLFEKVEKEKPKSVCKCCENYEKLANLEKKVKAGEEFFNGMEEFLADTHYDPERYTIVKGLFRKYREAVK